MEEKRDGNPVNRRVSLPTDRLLPLPSATAQNVLQGAALLDAMRASIDPNVRTHEVPEASFVRLLTWSNDVLEKAYRGCSPA